MPDGYISSNSKPKVITALFSGTGYDARCPGELISELGNGLVKDSESTFIFNGPGCENNNESNSPVFWDPLPEINRTKKFFNLIRRSMDIIFGSSMEKIIDDAVIKIIQEISNNRDKKEIILNLGGWSRGAVASAIVAGKIAKHYPRVKINLALVDPVSGSNHYTALKLPNQVKKLLVFYAQNESRSYMKPCNLLVDAATHINLVRTPGNHFSLVEPTYADPSYQAQKEPKVVWKLFISFFKENGTKVDSKNIQYYERVNKADLEISPFSKRNLNEYQTLDGLFTFNKVSNMTRGKIYLSDRRYYKSDLKTKLMNKRFPFIQAYLNHSGPLIKPRKEIMEKVTKEFKELIDHDCWNILTEVKEVFNNQNPNSFLSEFLDKIKIPTPQELVNKALEQSSRSNIKTIRLLDILPHKVKREPCITLHRVWSRRETDWKEGFKKLAYYYCETGIFTWRHHRDIFLSLIEFLERNKLATPQALLDHALALIVSKAQKTYLMIDQNGLFIQSLCYFRDRTKTIKFEDEKSKTLPMCLT